MQPRGLIVTQKTGEQELSAHNAATFERLCKALPRLTADLRRASHDTSYQHACIGLDAFQRGFNAVAAAWFAPILECEIKRQVGAIEQSNIESGAPASLNLDQKKQLSIWIGEELRQRGMTISREGKPCTLWAETHGRRTPQGHFRLATSRSKEKTYSSKDIASYFPLELMEAPRRKEGGSRWSERTAKGADAEDKHR